jgi:AraC-like DNA-binding protein
MPSSSVRTFSDPEDYAASIRANCADLTITAAGQFAGKIVRVNLHDLWLQRLSENLPHVYHATALPHRAVVSFWTQPTPRAAWNGLDVQPTQIVRHGEAQQSYWRASGPTQRATMSVPIDVIATTVSTMADCDLTPPRQGLLITPRPAEMAKLQRLHAEIGDLAENSPETIASSEAARGVEQALIQALAACLTTASDAENSLAYRRHERTMRRFDAAITEHPDEAIYIPELCTKLGVPERTLRLCCDEALGMGPKRYLMLRRMNLARQALRRADAALVTVTSIAANFGFFSFGRFSVMYKKMFGEMPSTTLHAAPS